MLDVRLPIGALFFILGIMIAAWGYTHPPVGAFVTKMGPIPINFDIIWGIFMTLFGMVMWSLAKLGQVGEMEAALAAEKIAASEAAAAAAFKEETAMAAAASETTAPTEGEKPAE